MVTRATDQATDQPQKRHYYDYNYKKIQTYCVGQ